MNQIFALMLKDLRLLLRDKVGFFFTFFFPLLMASFFGAIYRGFGDGGSSAINVSVVDEDGSPHAKRFIDQLTQSKELKVEVADRAAAEDAVRRGRRVAYVAFPKGFGEARDRMFWGDPATIQVGIDPSRGAEAGMLEGILARTFFEDFQRSFTDPSAMRPMIKRALTELRAPDTPDHATNKALLLFLPALDMFMNSLAQAEQTAEAGQADSAAGNAATPVDPAAPGAPGDDADPAGGQATPADAGASATAAPDDSGFRFEPLRVEKLDVARQRTGPRNPYSITFPQGILWGMLACTAAFSVSLVVERTRGTLVRLRTAPISRAHILGGKALACWATTIVLSVVLLGLAIFVFGVRPTSYALLVLAVLCISIAFVGIMMVLSVLGRTEQAVSGIGWGVLLVMAMIGGCMVPLMFMPGFMQTVSAVSPVKWSILALEGAIWRGLSPAEMLKPCLILVGTGVSCFLLGVKSFRWTKG